MNVKPTEDEIVQTLYDGLDDETIRELRSVEKIELIRLHHSLGQYIRNTYGLWDRPWVPLISNDVDCAPDHPDAVSMRIIEKLYDRLTDENTPPDVSRTI
jgi:hypothetical protein